MQWLGHNKTCPHCRETCKQRNIIRLYIDTSSTLSQADVVELDPQEMKVNWLMGLDVCVYVCTGIYLEGGEHREVPHL